MKKIATAVVAALAMAFPVVTAQPAAAGNNVVTKDEFRNAKTGMAKDRVHRIFDTKGRLSYQGYGYMGREYKTPKKYGTVYASFERRNGVWVLESKSAYWG